MHRPHVVTDLAQHPRLGSGQLEPKSRQKLTDEMIVARAGQTFRACFEFFATQLNRELQSNELV